MILPSNYWQTLTFTFYTFLAKPNNNFPWENVIDDIFPSKAFFCSVYVLHVCHTDGNWLVCIVPLWRCIVQSSVSHLVLLSIFHITFSVQQYIINTITTIYCDARYYTAGHLGNVVFFSASSTETTSPSSGFKCVFLAARFLLYSQSQMKTQQVCSQAMPTSGQYSIRHNLICLYTFDT